MSQGMLQGHLPGGLFSDTAHPLPTTHFLPGPHHDSQPLMGQGKGAELGSELQQSGWELELLNLPTNVCLSFNLYSNPEGKCDFLGKELRLREALINLPKTPKYH